MPLTVSVCIANYKQDKFLKEATGSVLMQTYPCTICVYNDLEGVGSGEAFNRAIAMANTDIIVLLCADDIFTDAHVIEDIVKEFQNNIGLGHISRWYHQFVDGDRHPVRAWRGESVIELANNPSGLAFRREALKDPCENGKYFTLTNKMFIEAPCLVDKVIRMWWAYSILRYDTVSVRVHKSTARSKDYYTKMWTSSPVEEWAKLGWKTNDFTHLIQVKNYFTIKAVFNEIFSFIRVNPFYIINPIFVFFSITALCTPRCVLLHIPEFYRSTWGRWTTRYVKRKI